jgi:hypothetical protein
MSIEIGKDNKLTQECLDNTRKLLPKNKYSDEEIENYMLMAPKLANKVIISYLIYIIKEDNPLIGTKNYVSQNPSKLIKELKKLISFNYSAHFSLGFEEDDSIKVNVSLSIGERDYQPVAFLASKEYETALYGNYDLLKSIAVLYWDDFRIQNKKLMDKIDAYRPDIDFCDLKIGVKISGSDKIDTTKLYFENAEKMEKMISIYVFHTDKKGNIKILK